MYKTDYQGGPFVEIFSAQGKDPTHGWKVATSIKREYEKDVKGYLYCLEGSTTTTKMQLPKANLVQRYLIFQVFVPRGKEFSFEIGVIDQKKNKRRLMFSSAQKDRHTTELHARIPLTILRRHVWLNLCVDLASVVEDTWRGQTYRCIESICVSANCKLRRIFTMKNQPHDTSEDEEMYGYESCNTGELELIPRQCQFASDVQFVTQILNMGKIKDAERLKGGDNPVRSSTEIDLNASGRRTSLNDSGGYHIAFGTKVPGAPTSSKNKGNVTNRSNRSTISRAEDAGNDEATDLSDSIFRDGGGFDPGGGGDRPTETSHRAVLHRRQLSDPATQQDLEMASRLGYEKPDLLVQPHPPREPSTDRLRRRIRVKNGSSGANKDRVSSAGSLKDEGVGSVSEACSAKSTSSHQGGSDDGRRLRLVSDTELIWKHKGDKVKSPERGGEEDFSSSGIDSGISVSQSYKKEYNRDDYEGDGAPMEEDLMSVINILNTNSGEQVEDLGEYEESEEEPESDSDMFLFVSKPKPCRRVSPSQLEAGEDAQVKSPTFSKGKQQRGPKLENDFVHSSDSSFEEEETQRRKIVPGSRPTSGSSSRPHSGSTTSRPQSGTTSRPTSGTTSRPQSGTASRPHSGSNRPPHNIPRPTSAKTQGSSSSKNSATNLPSKSGPKPQRKDKIDLSTEHVPTSAESPELQMSYQLPTHRTDKMNGSLSNRSISRMSRKSVKEIPKDDVRLSVIKSSEKPYDYTKYSAINFKMEDITDSFEAGMFSSMKRQTEEDYEDISASESPRKLVPPSVAGAVSNKTPPNPSPRETANNHRNLYDFSPTLTLTSDEDSTWQAPPTEMKLGVSTDTLTSSNPRDWSGAFSPPIVFPGGHPSDSIEDLSSCSLSPRKNIPAQDTKSREQTYAPSDDLAVEDELDLLYDSCLNCYYDPKTQKYYELI